MEKEILVRAREIILTRIEGLTESEIQHIENTEPHYSVYVLAGDYADYRFSWDLGSKRVVVFGKGKLFLLDGAKVELQSDLTEEYGSSSVGEFEANPPP